jgi:hypothetical protein
MIVIRLTDDIVVEHMIANYDQHLMMMMIDWFDDEQFLNVVVKQMDLVHLLMFHVFDSMMNDVVHYWILVHLLVIFYRNKKKRNFLYSFLL